MLQGAPKRTVSFFFTMKSQYNFVHHLSRKKYGNFSKCIRQEMNEARRMHENSKALNFRFLQYPQQKMTLLCNHFIQPFSFYFK
mmetsp:Transcript_18746/g.42801  ORF Transcript_18746/g.42801 Transcript_18746/m.42801 type:complete len:84 (+) Transcript_18746:268-519(+)